MSLMSCRTPLSLALLLPLNALATAADPATLDAIQVQAAAPPGDGTPDGAGNRFDAPQGSRQASMADALWLQPGVLTQSPGNEGSKVSIRGSGINRGPGAHASGLAVSLDGLPLTGPGGTPYELLEPLWLSRVEVLRGANGITRGALALGGAIDYRSRSGEDSPGLQLALEAGSHGYQRQGLGWGGVAGNHDYLLSLARSRDDGYQRHAASRSEGAMANLGWQLRPDLHTRLLLRFRQTRHQTPGRLTREQVRHDPRAANPANLAIDAQRPQPGSHWIGSLTDWQIDADSALQLGVVHHRYPMDLNESAYRQQLDYRNLNATLDYQRRHTLAGRAAQFRLGLRVAHDLAADVRESRRFDAADYPAGTTTRRFRHHGTDATLHAHQQLALTPSLDLHAGLALAHVRRDVAVTWPANDEGLRRGSWQLAPRLGLVWQASENLQWFGNLSRSLEPAHPWSMLWGSNLYFAAGNGPASGRQRAPIALDMQTATTLEMGARGQLPIGQWEVTGYHARLRNELLSVELQPAPELFIAENNASPTVHRGIEAALDSTLWQAGQGRLALRQAWTWSDFRYRNDPRFGRNTLPGLPRHAYQAELRADHRGGLHAALTADHATSMAVDYANSFRADARWLLGARIGFDAPAGRWQLWAELRNLTDRRYAASITPGHDDGGRDMARSTPGEGRSVYAGLRWRLD